MKIPIPKSIPVGGHIYKVRLVRNLFKDTAESAQCLYWSEQINIDTDVPSLTESFIHEVFHAVDRIYNNHSLSEDTVDALAEGWFQVLSDMGITFTEPGGEPV